MGLIASIGSASRHQVRATPDRASGVLCIALFTYSSGGMDWRPGSIDSAAGKGSAASFVVRPRHFHVRRSKQRSRCWCSIRFTLLSGHGDIQRFSPRQASLAYLHRRSRRRPARPAPAQAARPLAQVDVANLAELNQFIVRACREHRRRRQRRNIRLINGPAAQMLKQGPVEQERLGEVSPRLLYLLGLWRRQTHRLRRWIPCRCSLPMAAARSSRISSRSTARTRVRC